MARIRTIKPDIWVTEAFAECSTSARLLLIGLWNFSDDNGVHPAKPKTLKAEVFPMDDFSVSDVSTWVAELLRAQLISAFTGTDGLDYWHVTEWTRQQKIDRPSYKYPTPLSSISTTEQQVLDEHSSNQLDEASSNTRHAPPPGVEGRGKEGRGRRSPKAHTVSIPDDFAVSSRVRQWAADKGYGDPERHLEHFVGWARAGGAKYLDWYQAFENAIRDDWAGVRSKRRANGSDASTASIFAGAR